MNRYKVLAYIVSFVCSIALFCLIFISLSQKANAISEQTINLKEQNERCSLFENKETEELFYSQKNNKKFETKLKNVEEVVIDVIATAYCSCYECCGEYALNRPNGIVYTASGAEAKANHTIAVDTDVFPFGTVLEIGGVEYVAEDTGSAIVGNKIDIYFDSHETALEFGVQKLSAKIKRGTKNEQID